MNKFFTQQLNIFVLASMLFLAACGGTPTSAAPAPLPVQEPPLVGIDPACAQWVAGHPVQPGSKFGLKLSTSMIDVEMNVDETVEVLKITSTGSTGFNFCGYPYPSAPEMIYWDIWSGGLNPGSTTAVHITALKGGEYTGKVTLLDLSTGLSVDIPVKIVVK